MLAVRGAAVPRKPTQPGERMLFVEADLDAEKRRAMVERLVAGSVR